MTSMQPAIDLLEQELRALERHVAECSRHNALTAIRRATGMDQANRDRITSYRVALDVLRVFAGSVPGCPATSASPLPAGAVPPAHPEGGDDDV